jgi:succinate-semialdehyde dehydrogenase/glutarate-semialdehyde dehydrogenase
VTTLALKDGRLLKNKCYVAGEWIGAATAIPVTNPVDDSVIGHVPKLGAAETRKAIEAAQKAQKLWAKKTAKERAVVLRKWFELTMENQEDLALIMTAEQGKPLAESRGEIAYGASFIEFFAEEGKRIYGETIPSPWPTSRMVVIKQSLGVVAAITPWNFPNAMISARLAQRWPQAALSFASRRRRHPFPPSPSWSWRNAPVFLPACSPS